MQGGFSGAKCDSTQVDPSREWFRRRLTGLLRGLLFRRAASWAQASSHAIVDVGSCRRGFGVGVDGVPPTSAGRELVPSVVLD